MSEKEQKQECGCVAFFKRLFAKLDKKMEDKSKQSSCCCGPKTPQNNDQGSCCG